MFVRNEIHFNEVLIVEERIIDIFLFFFRETKNEKEKENFVPIEAEVINSGMIQGFNHITSETDSNGKIKVLLVTFFSLILSFD
jgi:hypothetical protein